MRSLGWPWRLELGREREQMGEIRQGVKTRGKIRPRFGGVDPDQGSVGCTPAATRHAAIGQDSCVSSECMTGGAAMV